MGSAGFSVSCDVYLQLANDLRHLATVSVMAGLWPSLDIERSEEQFYVLFPLLVLLLPRRLYVQALVALVLAGPVIRYVYSFALYSVSTDPAWSTFAVYGSSFAHFDALQ